MPAATSSMPVREPALDERDVAARQHAVEVGHVAAHLDPGGRAQALAVHARAGDREHPQAGHPLGGRLVARDQPRQQPGADRRAADRRDAQRPVAVALGRRRRVAGDLAAELEVRLDPLADRPAAPGRSCPRRRPRVADEQRAVAHGREARDLLEHLRVEVGAQERLALAALGQRQPAHEVGQEHERRALVLRVLVQEVVDLPRLVADPQVVGLLARQRRGRPCSWRAGSRPSRGCAWKTVERVRPPRRARGAPTRRRGRGWPGAPAPPPPRARPSAGAGRASRSRARARARAARGRSRCRAARGRGRSATTRRARAAAASGARVQRRSAATGAPSTRAANSLHQHVHLHRVARGRGVAGALHARPARRPSARRSGCPRSSGVMRSRSPWIASTGQRTPRTSASACSRVIPAAGESIVCSSTARPASRPQPSTSSTCFSQCGSGNISRTKNSTKPGKSRRQDARVKRAQPSSPARVLLEGILVPPRVVGGERRHGGGERDHAGNALGVPRGGERARWPRRATGRRRAPARSPWRRARPARRATSRP